MMKAKAKGILVMPESDVEMIRAKHWMVSRNITYRMVYIPVTNNERQPVLMATMDLVDRILFRLTFGLKLEKLNVYA